MDTGAATELALRAEVRQLRERIAELERDRQHIEAPLRTALASLQEERDRLAAAIASISDEVWFADVNRQFTLANPSAVREFQLAGAQATGVESLAASVEVYRPDGSPRPIEEAPPLRALNGETIRNEEEIVRTPGAGELRNRLVSSAPVEDASGRIIGSVSVVRDITGAKRAEEALHKEREWLRVTLNSIGDAVLATDSAGNVSFLNPAAERLTGWNEEEALGRQAQDVFRIINEQTREMAEDIVARVIRENTVVELANHSALLTRTGGEIPIEDTAAPIRDRAGAVSGVVVVFHDVTAKRRSQAALAAGHAEVVNEKNRLNALMEALPLGVSLIDAHGGTIASNRHFESLWGSPRPRTHSVADYAAYKAWWTATGAPVQPEEWASAQAVLHGRTVVNQEIRIQRFDGSRAFVLNSAAPIRDAEDRITGCAVAIADVTELKQAEEALKESEAILRAFFDSPGVMRGIVELDGRRITHVSCNAAAAEMFGIAKESISGKSATEAGATPEVARAWAELYEDCRRTGRPVSMEYARADARGRDRWLLATASHLGAGPAGLPRFAYTVVDISDRKRAEEQASRGQRTLSELIERAPFGIYVVDSQFRIAHMNAGSQAGAFRNVRPVIGRDFAEAMRILWPEPVAADIIGHFRHTLETGEPYYSPSFFNPRRDVETAEAYEWELHRTTLPDGQYAVICYYFDSTKLRAAESALRESEQKYRELFESIDQGFCTIEVLFDENQKPVDYRFLMVNPAFERQTGIPNAAGRRMREIAPQHEEHWFEIYGRIALTGEAIRFENPATQLNRYYEVYAWRVGAPAERKVAILFNDVSDRRRAEEALRASEERFRSVVENMSEGLLVVDAEGNPTYQNPASLRIHGFGNPAAGRVEKETLLETWQGWDDAGRPLAFEDWPISRVLRGERFQEQILRAVRVGTGQEFFASYNGRPILDAEGRVAFAFLTIREITEQRKAEMALRQSEEILRLAQEAAGVGAFDWNIQTGVNTWTRRLEQLYGLPPGAFGLTQPAWENLVHPEDRAGAVERVREALETGEPAEADFRVIWPDGSVHWLHGRWQVVKDPSGAPLRLVGVNLDVTQRKQTEERLRHSQKLESLGLLAGGVAHDFNNLLVGVIGNASLAQEMLPDDHAAAELIAKVVKTGEQAAHLTRQMLAYAGKGKFLVEPLDVSALVRDIIELVRPSIPKKIALKLELSDDLPSIEADRGQVQQILMNLAINAAEAIGSRDGMITVRTRTEVVDDHYLQQHQEAAELQRGRYVALEVSDTGCGMDAAVKAKIFDPFFSTKFMGRGLGLAAVAGIVRGHKGAIVVTSEQGQGTIFAVLFPPAPHAAQRTQSAVRHTVLKNSAVVLVIDDDRIVRELAKKSLERHGFTVLVADGGAAAIDVLKRHPGKIDIVLLDLSMPGMSGEDTLPELRKIRPDVKVFVSSGYSEAETMTMFSGQSVSGFIQKPYTSAGLAERLKRALE